MIANDITPCDRNGTIKRLDNFLGAFFSDNEPICIRAFKPKDAPDSPANRPRKLSITRATLRDDPSVWSSLRELNKERGVFFVVNAGGQTKATINRITAFFAESDSLPKEDQHRILDALPKPSIRVETRKSVHAYWLLDGACSVSEWEQFQLRLIAYLSGRGLRADATIKDASRVMRLPAAFNHLNYDSETGKCERVPVKCVEFEPHRRYTLAAMKQAFAKASNETFEAGPSKELPQRILDGEGRHKEMVSLAGGLRDRGLSAEEMLPTLRAVNAHRFEPPLADEKLQQIADSICGLYEASKPIGEPRKQEPLTDDGNAGRLIRSFGDVLRRDLRRKMWISWKGKRWIAANDDTLATEIARLVPNTILDEAKATQDEASKKQITKHAYSSQSARAIEAMARLAKSRGREIHSQIEDFDSPETNHLLNVTNGTIDLRTSELREHRKEDRITKLTRIEYEPDATAPLWEKFLDRIFDGNQAMVSFMQRVCGYSVTGATSEQCMFLLHGDGANGKSTFIEVVRAVMGEYAAHCRTEALMKHKNTSAGAASGDIAELRGARFVSAVETNVGQQLAEALLKQVTGQDVIKARQLYSVNVEFRPTFKLWLAANHKPEIAGVDHAIWRRIHLIPFDVTIPEHERDRRILDKLRAQQQGILAWCVRGASEWHRQGLAVPDEVKTATARYRAEEDILSMFIADTCEVGELFTVKVASLHNEYELWCRQNHEQISSRKIFNALMKAAGFAQGRHGDRVWKGLKLRATSAFDVR